MNIVINTTEQSHLPDLPRPLRKIQEHLEDSMWHVEYLELSQQEKDNFVEHLFFAWNIVKNAREKVRS